MQLFVCWLSFRAFVGDVAFLFTCRLCFVCKLFLVVSGGLQLLPNVSRQQPSPAMPHGQAVSQTSLVPRPHRVSVIHARVVCSLCGSIVADLFLDLFFVGCMLVIVCCSQCRLVLVLWMSLLVCLSGSIDW